MHDGLSVSELSRAREYRVLRTLVTSMSVLVAVAGLAMTYISQHTPRWAPPPAPPAAAAAARGAATGRGAAPLSRSLPVRVRVPSIGVDARIIPLGLGPGRTVRVPSLSTPMLASWFDQGAAPGQRGSAVLFGHVDTAVTGPAVFYRLGDLRPGDLIYVTRADGQTAVFRVNSVALFPQWSFPSQRVYGHSTDPQLRLITCGGDFDTQTHLYLDRTIAFASYLGHK
jgi:hypothetical protein